MNKPKKALEAKEKGTQIMDSVVGASPTQGVITLPSEAAYYLANHLENNQEDFIIETFTSFYIDTDNLAKVIQEYWDSLP